MKGMVVVESSNPQGCGRIFAWLADFWSHEPRFRTSQEEYDLGKSMHVLLDGKPIAQLDWIYDNQPVHVYRLTLIDQDHYKTEFALKTDDGLQSEMLKAERVLIQDRNSGSIKVPWLFLTAIDWKSGTLSVRDACQFKAPPREPLPEDEIPGWGSVGDAHKLIQETMRLDRLEYDKGKGRQSL